MTLKQSSPAAFIRYPPSVVRNFKYNKNLLPKHSNLPKFFKGITRSDEQEYTGVYELYRHDSQLEVCLIIKIENDQMSLFLHDVHKSPESEALIDWFHFIFAAVDA